MKIYEEINTWELRNRLWAGAKQNVALMTDEELETIMQLFDDCFPDGIDIVQVNDYFWFDTDAWCEIIGYNSFDDFWNERSKHDFTTEA